MRRRPVSLNECTTIREHVSEHVDPRAMTNSARRRRRLHDGALRFVRDVCADGRPFHRVLLVALTMRDEQPELARGAIQRLFEELKDLRAPGAPRRSDGLARLKGKPSSPERQDLVGQLVGDRRELLEHVSPRLGSLAGAEVDQVRVGTERQVAEARIPVPQIRSQPLSAPSVRAPRKPSTSNSHAAILKDKSTNGQDSRLRYFWWPEFQLRGALHYHAIIVDPPFEHSRDARHWFDAHWRTADGERLAGIQTWLDWKAADWFRRSAGNYVLKDVRKVAGKHYEQDYTRMPRGWRTFRSHQLTFEVREHQEHENKNWTICVARPDAPWHERQADIFVYRRDIHVPARDGCRLYRRRRRGRAAPAGLPQHPKTADTVSQRPEISRVTSSDGDTAYPRPVPRARLPESCPKVSQTQPVLTGTLMPTTGGAEQSFDVALTGPSEVIHTSSGPLHQRGRVMTHADALG